MNVLSAWLSARLMMISHAYVTSMCGITILNQVIAIFSAEAVAAVA